MAVNQSRSMNVDFGMGIVDSTYISISPDRGGLSGVPVERLSWPRYRLAGQFKDSPFSESGMARADMPIERKSRYGTDPRF